MVFNQGKIISYGQEKYVILTFFSGFLPKGHFYNWEIHITWYHFQNGTKALGILCCSLFRNLQVLHTPLCTQRHSFHILQLVSTFSSVAMLICAHVH